METRILVVDDNRDLADGLSMLMRLLGNDVRTAHDGVEALEAAEAFLPDAILLDLGLPRLDGYAVAQRIRAESWGSTMLLIAVTGWGQDKDRQRSREVGIDHHLVKPVDPATLTQLLSTLRPN